MSLNNSEQNETERGSSLWGRIHSLSVQRGWDIGRLAREAKVSRTTLHHWQQGRISQPRISTVFKLAAALEVEPSRLLGHGEGNDSIASGLSSADLPSHSSSSCGSYEDFFEDFQEQSRLFDRQTNWAIQSVCEQHPALFEDWEESQWDELFSSFGTGGEMNEEGIRREAEAINARQETLYQLRVVLETDLAAAACGVIRCLYESVQCRSRFGTSPVSVKQSSTEQPNNV